MQPADRSATAAYLRRGDVLHDGTARTSAHPRGQASAPPFAAGSSRPAASIARCWRGGTERSGAAAAILSEGKCAAEVGCGERRLLARSLHPGALRLAGERTCGGRFVPR